jgi:eukaryotic-like serine/threonine-protein kinase
MPLAAGARLGPYEIQSALGAGGMGEVYRAHDTRLERDVALKVLPAAALADETARARLVREARLASKLNHPHICTIYDVGESEGRTYVAMELVEGQSLSDRVIRGALPIGEVVAYGQQMAGALAHAHAKGVVHRDFKSANVVVTPEGEVKALDFGLAKRLASDELADGTTRSRQSLTEAGVVAGTLAYMAPEQLRGRPADARSDIWALGVVLYELAAGRRPFQGKTGFELSSAILSQPIPAVPASVPAPLAAVIDRCLAKEPGERYQRADDVRAALEALQTGTATPWMRWRHLIRRRAWPAWVGAALVVVSLLVGFDVGGVRRRLTGTHGVPRIESLAVLPLENLSGDAGQDYFAVGMTEALITDLARLGALKRVTARGSVMRYRGTTQSFAEIARDLKVDALITGSVLRSGGLVSLTVQLIDPKTEAQLWTNRYQRELKDVIRLQNDIVAAIVGELKVQLTPADQVRLASARPVNPDAYDALLKARVEANRESRQNLERAMEYCRLALQKDPGFALGHICVATVWVYRGHLGYIQPREAVPEVRAAIARALAIDERLAEAYKIQGSSQFYLEWNWEAARRSWRRAIELNPNDADVRVVMAAFSAAMGNLDGTSTAFEVALESDPHNPQLRDWYGHQLLRLRRYDEAIVQFRRVLGAEPNFTSSLGGLWSAYHFKQMYGEAAQYAARLLAVGAYPELGAAFERENASLGYAGALRNAAARREERSGTSFDIARMYAFAGDKDLALRWLEKAYQDGDSTMVYLKVDPSFDVLRDDPRFQTLLRKMNFPP